MLQPVAFETTVFLENDQYQLHFIHLSETPISYA
jgi:hypothetical protein